MFGLMRACVCADSKEARLHQKRLYCGTCKATGRLFGQRSRLTLNHDAVFLGELLLALERHTLPASFTVHRCFSLPVISDIPAPLAYAAAANIALAELAIADKCADNEGIHWKLAQRSLARAFHTAQGRLASAGVSITTLFAQHAAQAQVEANPLSLGALAAPTGVATRLIFAQGNREHSSALGELGEAFGRLVYTLDALIDQCKDHNNGAFNALTATETSSSEAHGYIQEQQARVVTALASLPLTRSDNQRFTLQLQANIQRFYLLSTQDQQERKKEERREQGCWWQCRESCSCLQCCGDCVCDGTCDLCGSCCEGACSHCTCCPH